MIETLIRGEAPADRTAVRALNEIVFDGSAEADAIGPASVHFSKGVVPETSRGAGVPLGNKPQRCAAARPRRSSRMVRSVLLSTSIYVVAFVAPWSVLLLSKGSGWRIPSLLQYATFSGVIVALAGFLAWPLLRAMRRLPRGAVLAAGALLAALPMAGLTAIFWDPGDGDSIPRLLRFWIRLPGEFLLGFVPMVLATGALAWFATRQQRETEPAPSPEKPV